MEESLSYKLVGATVCLFRGINCLSVGGDCDFDVIRDDCTCHSFCSLVVLILYPIGSLVFYIVLIPNNSFCDCNNELYLFLSSSLALSSSVQLIPRLCATFHVPFCTEVTALLMLLSEKTQLEHRVHTSTACKINMHERNVVKLVYTYIWHMNIQCQ